MASKKEQKSNSEFDELKKDIASGTPKNLYVFQGEERYLLSWYLDQLRNRIPFDTREFNYKRFGGQSLNLNSLEDAIDSMPVFADSTLIEVWDYDFSKMNEDNRKHLLSILSDVPDYTCLVFVFDTLEFKLDARIKVNAEIKKLLNVVEFKAQGLPELKKWTMNKMRAAGKKIDAETAEYLVFASGGMMTELSGEIDKLSSYVIGPNITRKDIDAVVTPLTDVQTYELTDAILSGNGGLAAKKLSDLMSMNEEAHKILFSVSSKIRQLFCAKVISNYGSYKDLMVLCGIKYDFQAKNIFNASKKLSLQICRKMVECTSETAYKLNSTSQDSGDILKEMLVKLIAYSETA